jgi:hypothetical protein
MSDMRSGGPAPAIGDLIANGVEFAKSAKGTLPNIAVGVLASIATPLLGQGLGGVVTLICSVAGVFLALMLAREAITGTFAYSDRDPMAAAKLVGIIVAIILAIVVLSIPVAFLVANSFTGLVIFTLLLMAIVIVAMARIVFLLPAYAMGDATSFSAVLAQTQPLWGLLIGLILLTGLPGVLFSLVFSPVGGAAGLILQLIGAVITSAAGVVTTGAISRLYAKVARPAM